MLKPVAGTWFEFRHHTACEEKYWDKECKAFTDKEWIEKIEEIASLGMKYIVLMAAALKLENEEKCYFKSDIFPMADLNCKDPMEVMFNTCDKYIDQLKRLDIDFVAYQDEVGVRRSSPEASATYYKALKEAHDKAGRSKIWADVEIFDFEGTVYQSALIPGDCNRILKQLEQVSPYVEEILCYQYQGMVNKPGTNAYCGSGESEKLYEAIKKYSESI